MSVRMCFAALLFAFGPALLAAADESTVDPAAAQDSLKTTIETLKAKAASEPSGKVRVIARLSAAAVSRENQGVPARDAAGSFQPAPLEASQQFIRRAQDLLIRRMIGAGANAPKRLEGLPMIALDAAGPQLDALTATGEIAYVIEDGLRHSLLKESGPRVGADVAYAMNARGAGTTIAILDSGVMAPHQFLNGRALNGACFSSNSFFVQSESLCPDGEETSTYVTAGNPCTLNGCEHGTHVAGIAAGKAFPAFNANGIAPEAKILPIMIDTKINGWVDAQCVDSPRPCAAIFDSDAYSALHYVQVHAAELNIVAVNMSWGSEAEINSPCDTITYATRYGAYTITAPYKELIDHLADAGVATVIAAGNAGKNHGVAFPACISSAITVGATDDNDAIAPFSNHGKLIDLMAPGDNITSSVPNGANAMDTYSGTSGAAPHVAGAIAVLRSQLKMSVAEELALLQSTGDPVSGARNNPSRVRLNIGRAIQTLIPVGPTFSVTNKPAAVIAAWAAQPGVKIANGDFDGDGKMDDIALVGGVGWTGIRIAYGEGGGVFSTAIKPAAEFAEFASRPGVKMVSGDFDGDGKIDDLALAGGAGWTTIPVAFGQGAGDFTFSNNSVSGFPQAAAAPGAKLLAGDFNADGKVNDLALVGAPTLRIFIAVNVGPGQFKGGNTPLAPFAVLAQNPTAKAVVGDFDADGKIDDIALVGGSGWDSIPIAYHKDGAQGSGFGATTILHAEFAGWAAACQQVVAGDFDGDNHIDDIALVGGAGWYTQPVALGQPGGTFKVVNGHLNVFPELAAAPGVKAVNGNFDGDVLRDDIALLGGAGWKTIPVAHGNAGTAVTGGGTVTGGGEDTGPQNVIIPPGSPGGNPLPPGHGGHH